MGNNEDDSDDDVDNIFGNDDNVVSLFLWLALLWVVPFCDNFLRDVVDNFILEKRILHWLFLSSLNGL